MRGLKDLNEYATAGGMDLYEACPKAVFAAMAVSSLTLGGDYLDEARSRLLKEWMVLYQQGIVKQSPPSKLSSFVPDVLA